MAGRLISLTLLIIGIVSLSGCPFMVKPEPAGNQAPVIDDFYAVPYIGLGQTWKVFVKAHDPDGDLWEARFGIEQPGVMYGTFDGDVILPREMWKSLDGFFFLHQSSGQSMGLAGLKFVLTVEMIDRGGPSQPQGRTSLHHRPAEPFTGSARVSS